MSYSILNANSWSAKDKRTEEAFEAGHNALYEHSELVKLEKMPVKNLEIHTQILSSREYLKARIRDYPEILEQVPVLRRFA